MILPVRRNPNNKFTVVKVHYSADPQKNDEWVEMARRGMTERGWNREYEIDYTSFAGKPVWDNFKEYNIAKEPIAHQPGKIIYRGWDYGYHRPCCVITWLNPFDQWCWKKSILGQDESIYDFGMRVKRYCEAEFPGGRYIDAGDPAGEQVSDKGEKTSVQILNSMGIYPRSRKQPIKQGIEIVRKKFDMRADGKPGILVDPQDEYFIDMCKGGLHYPEAKEGMEGTEKEYYEKDGYYDHGADALRYLATEMFDVVGTAQLRNEITDPDKPMLPAEPDVNVYDDTGILELDEDYA